MAGSTTYWLSWCARLFERPRLSFSYTCYCVAGMASTDRCQLGCNEFVHKGKTVVFFLLLVVTIMGCAQSPSPESSVAGSAFVGNDGQGETTGSAHMDPNPLNEKVRNWALTSQAVVTMIAVSVGGWFAWRNRHLFRFGQPHLTISHEITHRRVSPEYVQVTVTAILQNTSRVKVEIRDGLFTIQMMAPISDAEAEEIYAKTFLDTPTNRTLVDHGALKWKTLDNVRLSWNEEELIAEPGESATATFEYIVHSEVESLLITTYFYNSRAMGKIDDNIAPEGADKSKRWLFWKQPGPRGWVRTTPHDIIVARDAADSEAGGA